MKREEVAALVGAGRMKDFDWWIVGRPIQVLEGGAVDYLEEDVRQFAEIPKTRW